MKTCLVLLVATALAEIQCRAQSITTPFSWNTVAGNQKLTLANYVTYVSNYANGGYVSVNWGYADKTNSDALFESPTGVAVDLAGNLYVSDAVNQVIRKVAPVGTNWVVTTLAGLPGGPGYGDGTGSEALFNNPLGVAVDTQGNVYVADTVNNAIREITPDGTVSTLAGNPFLTNSTGFQLGGYLDGPASVALFNDPTGVAVDSAGNVYVADEGNNVVRKLYLPPGGTNWQVATLAGNPGFGYKDGTGTNAQFYGLAEVAVDGAGNVYVADNSNSMIRKVTPEGVVTTLAGQDQGFEPLLQGLPNGYADGPGATAQFFYPYGVAADGAGNVYVADTFNSEIRKVTPQGVVTTLGGDPNYGSVQPYLFGFAVFGALSPYRPSSRGGYTNGIGSDALFNYPTGVAVDSAGNVYAADDDNFVIRMGARPAITITALRAGQSQAQVDASDDIDAPIVPVVDPTALSAGVPLGQGVVADGVTPVLFAIVAAPGNYTCQLSLNNHASLEPLSDYFSALQNGQWANGDTVSITTSGSIGTNFAYLRGFEWSMLNILTNEVEAVLTVVSAQSGLSNICSFRIRPPPVALVHGYSANGTSWTPAFTNALAGMTRPADFIIPISYGSVNGNNTVNTTWTLAALVPVLDAALRQQVETPLAAQWAFTRYDVGCHSQGGVLTRMLCQNVWSDTPVVAAKNFFRGRFRRVITIGSPHNGSVLLRYILQMNSLSHALVSGNALAFEINRILVLGDIAQKKFDPFGDEIKLANNPTNPVDPRIKFQCVRTTIAEGQRPSLAYHTLDYAVLGLCLPQIRLSGQSPGQLLLPRGSDGVVDFDSQGAGVGTAGTIIANTPAAPADISHADSTYGPFGIVELFGVRPGNSQTSDVRVGLAVHGLLDAPDSSFGPFVLPTLLFPDEQALVDSLVPQILPGLLTSQLPGLLDVSSNFTFQAQLPPGVATEGSFGWFAEVCGTNGFSTNGVTLQQNTNDASQITISVDEGVRGTLVLYSFYDATNGTLVVGNPLVVVNRPLAAVPASIFIDPAPVSLPVGGTLPLNLWAQYSNGASSLLYTPAGQAGYSSSNTNSVTVDPSGNVSQIGFGSSVVTATYAGLSAQTLVSSMPVGIRKFSGSLAAGGFQLSYLGSYGTTNVIEMSTNLVAWTPLAQFMNTSEFVTYTDPIAANAPTRFYRVRIP
jgi:hypothetical protein